MKTFITLIVVLLFTASCKKKEEDPTPIPPVLNNNYNWYAAQVVPVLDTLKVEDGYLYYSAKGLNNSSAQQQFTLAWAKGNLDADFEITLAYDNLQSDISMLNCPFSFSLFPSGDISKSTSVNLGTTYTLIQYGNGGTPNFNTDFKTSYSGTVLLKRTGADFSISITKDYLNGGTPDQFVQQSNMADWFTGKANFSFMVLNGLSAQRARIHWKSFSIKNAQGTIVESFDSNEILLK